MVGCDNEECPIEWFHFDCVGVTEEVLLLPCMSNNNNIDVAYGFLVLQ